MYLLSDYDYHLPEELIAQSPTEKRDHSRLLVLDKSNGHLQDQHFYDLDNYLTNQDILVINNVKVEPLRIFGKKQNAYGREIEVLLLKKLANGSYEALLKPAKKVPPGSKIFIAKDTYLLVESLNQDTGHRSVRFQSTITDEKIIQTYGQAPIPPYIKKYQQQFKEKYQTVYAKNSGGSAVPTAGLHFTSELLQKIKNKGIEIVELTLYVGSGTFQPIRVKDIRQHQMHLEKYSITPDNWEIIEKARATEKKIVCVGTTSVRTLESIFLTNKLTAETDIFIYPGFKFQVVDKLITNFHLPSSSLMLLVSAFAGYENIKNAYKHAVDNRYRFFSFGDAMLIQ